MVEKTLKEVIDALSSSRTAYKFARVGGVVSLAVENGRPYWKARPVLDGSRGMAVSFV